MCLKYLNKYSENILNRENLETDAINSQKCFEEKMKKKKKTKKKKEKSFLKKKKKKKKKTTEENATLISLFHNVRMSCVEIDIKNGNK